MYRWFKVSFFLKSFIIKQLAKSISKLFSINRIYTLLNRKVLMNSKYCFQNAILISTP